MSDILASIVEYKRQEIAAARALLSEADLERLLWEAPPLRDFRAALLKTDAIAIIAEVKKASPSAGVLRQDFDPVAIAKTYADSGASCISVLTDGPSFQGSLDYLSAIRSAVTVPLLRKDFILERYQLLEARRAGADAVLLIAEILEASELVTLVTQARELGLETLVELYDADNLPKVLASGTRLVGINNRDLRTFDTRLAHTLELRPAIPAEICLVSESGIRTHADLVHLKAAGVHAVLVGETLMRAPNIGEALLRLRGESP